MSSICKPCVTCPMSHSQSAVKAGPQCLGLGSRVFSVLSISKMLSPPLTSPVAFLQSALRLFHSSKAGCVAVKSESPLSGTFLLLLWQQRCSGLGTLRLCVTSWCIQGPQPFRSLVSWTTLSFASAVPCCCWKAS